MQPLKADKKTQIAWLLTGAAIACLVFWLDMIVHVAQLRPGKYSAAAFLAEIFIFWLVILAFATMLFFLVAGIAGLFYARFRVQALVCLAALGLLVFSTNQSIQIMQQARHDAFSDMSLRSASLINAIRSYEKDKGKPPYTLEFLVPEYLERVPGTGIPIYPEYEYRILAADHGNAWELSVFTPLGIPDFDSMIYLPNQDYQERDLGEVQERIGDWVYIHE